MSTCGRLGKAQVGNNLDIEGGGNKSLSSESYKRRTTVFIRRGKFLDIVCEALSEYKYVGPNQREDLILACRYVYIFVFYTKLHCFSSCLFSELQLPLFWLGQCKLCTFELWHIIIDLWGHLISYPAIATRCISHKFFCSILNWFEVLFCGACFSFGRDNRHLLYLLSCSISVI